MPCSITAPATSVSRRGSVRPPTRSVPPSGRCWRIKAPRAQPARPVRTERKAPKAPKALRDPKVYRVRRDRKARPEPTVRPERRDPQARPVWYGARHGTAAPTTPSTMPCSITAPATSVSKPVLVRRPTPSHPPSGRCSRIKARPAQPVQQVRTVRRDPKARKDPKASPVLRDRKVRPARTVRPEPRDPQARPVWYGARHGTAAPTIRSTMPCSITAPATSVSKPVSVRPPTRSHPPSGRCWRIKARPAQPVQQARTVRRDPKGRKDPKGSPGLRDRKADKGPQARTVRPERRDPQARPVWYGARHGTAAPTIRSTMPCSITAPATSVSKPVSVRPPMRSHPPSGRCWQIKARPAQPVQQARTVRKDLKVRRDPKASPVLRDRKVRPARTVRPERRDPQARPVWYGARHGTAAPTTPSTMPSIITPPATSVSKPVSVRPPTRLH